MPVQPSVRVLCLVLATLNVFLLVRVPLFMIPLHNYSSVHHYEVLFANLITAAPGCVSLFRTTTSFLLATIPFYILRTADLLLTSCRPSLPLMLRKAG